MRERVPRIGHGYDLHRLEPGPRLVLAGVSVSEDIRPVAHSDGDVVLHALVDALLGAMGWGDIGEHFADALLGQLLDVEGVRGALQDDALRRQLDCQPADATACPGEDMALELLPQTWKIAHHFLQMTLELRRLTSRHLCDHSGHETC